MLVFSWCGSYFAMKAANNKGADQPAWMNSQSEPLLFTYAKSRFFHDMAQIILKLNLLDSMDKFREQESLPLSLYMYFKF